jgi:hypothetical protein
MKERLTPEMLEHLPDDFAIWIDTVIQTGDDLDEILQIMTGDKKL